MNTLSTTVMSSKGQVVIPEAIRGQLGLHTGSQFVVLSDQDVIILKTITPPSLEKFSTLITQARKQAKQVGLKKTMVRSIIKKVRKAK